MKRLVAKLGFVHRTLWQREQLYRWAVLLGPPPLVGCAVAGLILAGAQQLRTHAQAAAPGSDAPWMHWTRPVVQDGQPFSEAPSAPVPGSDATGRSLGLQPGWAGSIQPFTVDATMDVNVLATSIGSFTLDQPTIPLARILDAGPSTGLFVGTGRAFFVAQTAGLYAFSARLALTGTRSAHCTVRLVSAHHTMLRNVVINNAANAVLEFPVTEFRLDPGLYPLQVAVGCWRGDHMSGPGELTLMVRHPGDTALKPVTTEEVLRVAPRSQNGAAASAPPSAQ